MRTRTPPRLRVYVVSLVPLLWYVVPEDEA